MSQDQLKEIRDIQMQQVLENLVCIYYTSEAQKNIISILF